MKRYIAAIITVIAVCSNSMAVEKNQPIVIEAQKLDYDKNHHKATYIGGVTAQRGDILIRGDTLVVFFDRTNRYVEKLEVNGNVKITREDGNGTCKKLEYFPSEEKLVLSGDAKLTRDGNTVIGDRIVAFKNGKIKVEGIKQKVKTIIFTGSAGKTFEKY